MTKLELPKNSLLFAPMEGITDALYREIMAELYPEWDRFCCDFLRVPSAGVGLYPKKHVLSHYGREIWRDPDLRKKTTYQILAPHGSEIVPTLETLKELEFHWVDLNLGCPSKTVCKHFGGSYLLNEIDKLTDVIQLIRENWSETFTVKMRVGYKDDVNFYKALEAMEKTKVDAIIIHGRTRDQLYKGRSNWDYIKDAVEFVGHTPIIGNGDIWTTEDIHAFFDYTKCHSIMLARSAIKTPWLARLYKSGHTDSLELRSLEIKRYLSRYYQDLIDKKQSPAPIALKRLKAVSRYLFDDYKNGEVLKRGFMRSKTIDEAFAVLD